MPSPSRLGLILFSVVLAPAIALAQASPTETLPPVKLRGYGTLGGTWQTVAHGTVLHITCDSEEKAKIVQAKYVSDLQELPGVQAASVPGATALPGWTFNGETFVSARDGKDVYVLSGDSPDALAKIALTALPATTLVYKPEVTVPMFLDRWDQHGFRFYYDTRSVPDGKDYSTFDKGTEIDWSVKNQTGLQVWDPVYEYDVAQGITSRNDISWATDAAREKHIPLGINLSTNNQVWLENWFPQDMAQHMPQFLGAYYNGPMVTEDGMRFLSWDSITGENYQLATIQQDVKHFNAFDNVTSWLEPHGEMGHGDSDFLMDYGPVADVTFRSWLKARYGDNVQTISQRYTGKPDSFTSWNDVHVPELASFCGWGPDALDLTGQWKVDYLDQTVTPDQPINYPNETFFAAYDDSKWPEITAPGDAHASFLPKFKPAVFRRTFNVDAAWLQAHPRQWLYVFDMNRRRDKLVIATLNGKEIGRSPVVDPTDHRDWYEATGALRPGANTLALALPDGYLAYRVYFSGTVPRMYPDLGEQLNAKWADFADWATWSRVQKAQRGMEMIRQVDPDRGIILMSPGSYYGELELARTYGGDFHDTGAMAGFWDDVLPQLMNGVGMPSSVEPGGPSRNVHDLESSYGYWSTEGSNAVDYFLTLGDIFWHPDLKADFEANLNLWHLFGKSHFPPAQFASFVSERDANRLSFPWNIYNKNLAMRPGFFASQWNDQRYPGSAAICEQQFLNNYVDRYKVIFDSNSSILDPDMIDAIERYVKQGGIFVTYDETGRHSDTAANSWPISKLTGYNVVKIDPYPNNDLQAGGHFDFAPGQPIYPVDKMNPKLQNGSGLHLQKVAPECQNLLTWTADGSVAAGMRPLGKGYIIQMGAHWDSVGWGETATVDEIFDGILDWANIHRDPIELQNVALDPSVLSHDAVARGLIYRHYISNNGLYDVFNFWNNSAYPQIADLVFTADGPAAATVVKTGASVPLVKNDAGQPTFKIALAPNEPAGYIFPRSHPESAARAWFDLQREWWKGTTTPPPTKLPDLADLDKATVQLGDDWAFKPLAASDSPTALAAPGVDDSTWPHRSFTAQLQTVPTANPTGNVIVYRKKVTIPAGWTNGPVKFFLTPNEAQGSIDNSSLYVDGTLIKDHFDTLVDSTCGDSLKAGSTHTFAIVVTSKSCLIGSIGNCWLYYRPDPTQDLDLAGDWDASDDGLDFSQKQTIPGPWNTNMIRGVINIPAAAANQTVLLHFEKIAGRISGAIINGTYVGQSHVPICPSFDLNLTPWIKFGADNKLEIVAGGKMQGTVGKIALDFYDPGTYP